MRGRSEMIKRLARWYAELRSLKVSHDVCVTKDGRNLHDEGYCDVTGQDDNEWRG